MNTEPNQHLGADIAIGLERETMIAEVTRKIEKLFQGRETINPLIIEEKLVFHLDVLNFLVNKDCHVVVNNLASQYNVFSAYEKQKHEAKTILVRENKLKQDAKVDYLWQVSRNPSHWANLLSAFMNAAICNIHASQNASL